jgi:hypothetical protein
MTVRQLAAKRAVMMVLLMEELKAEKMVVTMVASRAHTKACLTVERKVSMMGWLMVA